MIFDLDGKLFVNRKFGDVFLYSFCIGDYDMGFNEFVDGIIEFMFNVK